MKAFAVIGFIGFLYISCSEDKDLRQYNELMGKELASGKRVDSIFFGIYLGMKNKEFFLHCWDLNKKGLFTDGVNNTSVLVKLNKNELKFPASMNFYPDFYENKINKMTASFQYDGWAPWNKHLFADSLVHDVLHLYEKWYSEGNSFIQLNDETKGTIYVKVDGNRRITIGRYNDMIVKVDYTDLLLEKQGKKK